MGNRPSSREVAAYASEHTYCRRCKAQAGAPCIEQEKVWQIVCKVRFADAAREYVPLWKEQNKPAAPPEPVLIGVTRAAVPVPAGDDETCPF
jgi:hypothetical protein